MYLFPQLTFECLSSQTPAGYDHKTPHKEFEWDKLVSFMGHHLGDELYHKNCTVIFITKSLSEPNSRKLLVEKVQRSIV